MLIRKFILRDKAQIFGREFLPALQTANLKILIFLHGSFLDSIYYSEFANYLSLKGEMQVLLVDMRGHGLSSGTPGALNYIEQLEDDLAEVISQYAQIYPSASILLGGHSAGAAITLRYMQKYNDPKISARDCQDFCVNRFYLSAAFAAQNTYSILPH